MFVKAVNLGNLADGDIGFIVKFMDNILHLSNLETVYNNVDHGLFLIRIEALCIDHRYTAGKCIREFLTDFLWLRCNDIGGVWTGENFFSKKVNPFYDKVDSLKSAIYVTME
mgnify:CR=1 FL=1